MRLLCIQAFWPILSGGQEKWLIPENTISGILCPGRCVEYDAGVGTVIAIFESIRGYLAIVIPLADILILCLGLLLLANINPLTSFQPSRYPFYHHPFANAFVYGCYTDRCLALFWTLSVRIFAYSLTVSELLGKLSVFLWFGLGFGLPLLLLSILSGSAQRWITYQFAQRSRLLNIIGGVLLIGVAIYDIIANWSLIRTMWT